MNDLRASAPLLEQVLSLPRTHQHTIGPDFIDQNGHMNVMFYTALGNEGIGPFIKSLGLPSDTFEEGRRGMFALRQVISYLAELRQGEEVAVHTGLVGHDAKRLHFVHYIVSLNRQQLASSDERVAMYMDMTTRRSAVFRPDATECLARARATFAASGWKPELSGAIRLKES